ncbi:FliM/FliN family flagellar motor C-terminal domain-containing protein [Microbulbifer sp. TYP-18]|uniref:FliM/FliN family flagellar motor C-terminal domain-containing protein n=1 Tax=Microbulbifer sp. TYP-18 TaxID=3230024 RepID=UPI0034C6C4DA
MNLSPFYVYPEDELKIIESHISSLIAKWSENWLPAETVQVHASNAFKENFSTQDVTITYGSHNRFYLSVNHESLRMFASHFLGSQISFDELKHPVVRELLLNAWQELLESIPARGRVAQLDNMPPNVLDYGVGWAAVTLTLKAEARIKLFLTEETVRSLFGNIREFIPDETPLVPVESVVHDDVVGVSVELGRSKIGFAQLNGLKIGDVVQLEVKIGEPVKAVTSNNVPIFSGQICETKGNIGILVENKL